MLLKKSLLRLGWAQRWYFGLAGLLGIAGGAFSIWQARLFSRIIGQVFLYHSGIDRVAWALGILFGVMLIRSGLMGGQDILSASGAFHLKLNLRRRIAAVLPKIGIAELSKEAAGELAETYLEGVEALEAYFGQYLPQVFIAGFVPPIIIVAVFLIDPLSGVIFIVTGPLIPLFMRLIGEVASQQTQKQWHKLSSLSAFLLEAIQALPMLKRLSITNTFVERVSEKGNEYRQATLEVLKVTFLSAFVLELLTTLSTAVVAVQVGLRLLYGWIPFEEALFVLVLAPEFYLPLRLLGQRFHAGMAGVSSGERIDQLLQKGFFSNNNSKEKVDRPLSASILHKELNHGIIFDSVSFSQPERGLILEKVDCELKPGEITVVTGESGSGKSTLVNLLLGFLKPTKGNILIGKIPLENDHLSDWWDCIAWVPQNPYFFHGTIQDNICLGNPKITRSEVVRAAELAHADQFIKAFPQGYQTIIGEGGVGLSAGQAQRIALARAFLKNAPVLILDEGSANIDSVSLESILDSLISYKDNRIILFITHQARVIAIADKELRLDNFALQEVKRTDKLTLDQAMLNQYSGHEMFEKANKDEPFIRANAISSEKRSRLLKQDSSGDHPLIRLISFLFPLWNWVTLAIALSVAAILSNVGLMYTSAFIISSAALQPSIASLQVAIVGVRFFGISRGVWRYFERLISHRVTLDLLTRMRVWFYRTLEPLLPGLFLKYPSGDLMSRLLGDIAALEPFYVRAIAPFFSAILVGLVVSLAFIRLLPKLTLMLALLFFLATFVLPLIYQWISERYISKISKLRGDLNAQLVNIVQGLGELLVNRRLPHFEYRLNQRADQFGRSHLGYGYLLSSQTFLMNVLAYFAMWLTLGIAIPVVVSGQISGVILAGLALAVYVSFEAFMGLPSAAQVMVNSRQAAARLLELTEPIKETKRTILPLLELKGEIEFTLKNVTFSYPRTGKRIGDTNELISLPPAVMDINLVIPYGKRIGIVGQSGSGKTTLLYLLMGLYSPNHGQILVNKESLERVDLYSLRKNIASSGQDDFLFHDTLENNLCLLNPKASRFQVNAAIEAACLGDLVGSLPSGLNTIIGEQGKQLSGGERKRVLIARTLLRDAQVYIFDEPFAQLDESTAKRVMRNILDWCAGKTIILVSHYHWGLDELDEIIVMNKGRIVQRGSYNEVVQAGESPLG